MNSRRRSLLVLGSVAIFVIIAAGSLVFLERLQVRHRRQTADVVQREEQLAGLLQELRSNALLETSATAGYISLRDPSLIPSFYMAKSQAELLLDQLSSVSAGDVPLAKEVRDLSELHGDIAAIFAQIIQSSESGTDLAAITGVIPADFPSVARGFPERIRVAADAASARLIDAQQKDEAVQARFSLFTYSIIGAWTAIVAGAGVVVYFWAVKPAYLQKQKLLLQSIQVEREKGRIDFLTGVLQHGAIVEQLRDLLGANQRLSVAFVDVDQLKTVNDTYGHDAGDDVLRLVAASLNCEEAIVGRYGSDEFLILLPGQDRQRAEEYRRRVLQTISARTVRERQFGAEVPASISIGIAVFPEEAESLDDLLKLADEAMYDWRRQRTPNDNLVSLRYALNDREAHIVGLVVPLLTAPGSVERKLSLVAHQLSVGAGFDAVSFLLLAADGSPPTCNTFAKAPRAVVDAWNRDQVRYTDHPITEFLKRSRRPVIISDPVNDARLPESQKALLAAAGIRCAIVAPMTWQDKVVGIVSAGSTRPQACHAADATLLVAVANQVTAIIQTNLLLEKLGQAHIDAVMLLASAAEAHDPHTGRHLLNMRRLAETIAEEMGCDTNLVADLGLAAVLHDIGKVRVPATLLSASDALGGDDWEVMKLHTIWGEKLLSAKKGYELAANTARWHHERWDGHGYPDQLSGQDVPPEIWIVQIADALDAITSDRPYRHRRSLADAIAELAAGTGKQFSPDCVSAVKRLWLRGGLSWLEAAAETQAA